METESNKYPPRVQIAGAAMVWVGMLFAIGSFLFADLRDRTDGILLGLGCSLVGAVLYGIGTTMPQRIRRTSENRVDERMALYGNPKRMWNLLKK